MTKPSDTPRSDLELSNWDESPPVKSMIELSRQLEHELNAAKAQIGLLIAGSKQQERQIEFLQGRVKALEAVVNDPHALWANWLRGTVKLPAGIGDVRQYQERIQRLVEAGDQIDANGDEQWEKAKEGL
jgi:hypothetical protein